MGYWNPFAAKFAGKFFRGLELWWHVHPKFRRRGVASQAACLLINHLFDATPTERLQATIVVGNDASCRVAERAGMQRDGIYRDVSFLHGRYVSLHLYAIVRGDWKDEGAYRRGRPDLAQFPDVQGKNRDVGYGRPPVHTRFKKGQSGNPKGRPRFSALSDALRTALAEAPPAEPQPGVESNADVIALALIDRATRGDVAAAKEIADRTEGKARQAVQLSYTKREMYENAVRAIMDEVGCTRGEAIEAFAVFKPDALDLLDEE